MDNGSTNKPKEPKRLNFVAQFAALFLGAAVGVAAIYAIAVLYLGSPISDALKSAHGILVNENPMPVTADEYQLIADMIEQGKIIPANGHVSDVADYYRGVIEILVMVIALLSVLAFIVVRATSKHAAEDMAEQATERAIRRFFGTQDFHDQVMKAVKARSKDVIGDLRGYQEEIDSRIAVLDKAVTRAEDLEVLIVAAEGALARLDDYEAVGGELELRTTETQDSDDEDERN